MSILELKLTGNSRIDLKYDFKRASPREIKLTAKNPSFFTLQPYM